jgi:hypothetical protein
MAIEGSTPGAIPNKFLVPFMEKASLEDADSELIEKWTSLLQAAAEDFKPHMTRFISMLAELGPAEIKLLHKICRANRNSRPVTFVQDVPIAFASMEIVRSISGAIGLSKSARENIDKIIRDIELPGGIIRYVAINDRRDEEKFSENFHPEFDRDDEISFSLLQSLGLINWHQYIFEDRKFFSWYGEAIALTPFGLEFVLSCDREIRDAVRRMS